MKITKDEIKMLKEIESLLKSGVGEMVLYKSDEQGTEYELFVNKVLQPTVSTGNHITHYSTIEQAIQAFMEATA